MKIDITWEMRDKIILAGLLDSLETLEVEIKELKAQEHLQEHQMQDLHDARVWMIQLMGTYRYYSFDISALERFTSCET